MEDTLAHTLVDTFPKKTPMGITGQNTAKKYGITRDQAYAYALLSQQRNTAAHKAGVFDKEIKGIVIKGKQDVEVLSVDECPFSTTLESLAKLKPVFIKDAGIIVTSG